jgi:hypothetical protein
MRLYFSRFLHCFVAVRPFSMFPLKEIFEAAEVFLVVERLLRTAAADAAKATEDAGASEDVGRPGDVFLAAPTATEAAVSATTFRTEEAPARAVEGATASARGRAVRVDTVFDLCCGHGLLGLLVAARFPQLKVV